MKNLSIFILSLILALFMVSCGDDEEETASADGDDAVSNADAVQVYNVVSTAAGEAQSAAMSAVSGSKTATGFEYNADDGSFSGTIEGAEGGSVDVTGSGTLAADNFDYSFTMSFNGYVSQGTTLDGEVELAYAGSQTAFEMTYSGTVSASGSITGTVDFDLTYKFENGTATFEGTVGGVEMSASGTY